MSRNAEIQEELMALQSPLAAMPRQMPFAVPEGYFESLPATLATGARFAETDEPAMPEWPKTMPFQAPPQYFNSLAEALTASARTMDFSKPASLPYEVPAGYLENLPAGMLRAALNAEKRQTGKVRTIAFVPSWRRWAGVAAAAVLLLTLSLGTYRYVETHTPDAVAARQLSHLDADSISAYVEQHLEDFDEVTLEGLAAAQPGVETCLPTLDAGEIQQYLEERGELPQHDKESTL